MMPTRRRFLAAGLATVGTATVLDSAAAAEAGTIECLDYGRSFATNGKSARSVTIPTPSASLRRTVSSR